VMASPIQFTITSRCRQTHARTGTIATPHGMFETPAFMPVGTRGTLKGLTPNQVAETGTQIVLNNAYHLMLRPGDELVAQLGGVHRFMQWGGPILTDSGGYQAFSMSDINSVDDDGVMFASIIDGSRVHLGPERSMQVQNNLGADIIMAFDDCPPAETSKPGTGKMPSGDSVGSGSAGLVGGKRSKRRNVESYSDRLRLANERTIRWLERCVKAHARSHDQALFGIVQGGTDLELRAQSARQVTNIELPGYAIGGVAVGEGTERIRAVTEFAAPLLPADKPRYLMGVGYEWDIVAAVRAGVDMFDCVLPTRNGRNANAFTRTGPLHLRNARYREDPRPLEEGCDCQACTGLQGGATQRASYGPIDPADVPCVNPVGPGGFSRCYLRHLFLSREMLGPILVSIHNIRHFQRLMLDIRRAIREDGWSWLYRTWPVLRADADRAPAHGTDDVGPISQEQSNHPYA
jgi:queuine tRNA-ribosyltransferase